MNRAFLFLTCCLGTSLLATPPAVAMDDQRDKTVTHANCPVGPNAGRHRVCKEKTKPTKEQTKVTCIKYRGTKKIVCQLALPDIKRATKETSGSSYWF